MLVVLLSSLISLLIGFYARDLRDKVNKLYELWRDKLETPPGVVRPIANRETKSRTTDETSETGGVLRPNPTLYAVRNQQERDRKLKLL